MVTADGALDDAEPELDDEPESSELVVSSDELVVVSDDELPALVPLEDAAVVWVTVDDVVVPIEPS